MKRVFLRKKKKRSRLFFSTPYVLGITGEPGSGKTYVTRQLVRRHRGIRVLDADQLAQMLSGRRRYVALASLEKMCFRRAQAKLTRLMGHDSWTHEALIERAYREPVFLDRIEKILHTELRRVLEIRLGVFRRQGLRWVVFDCPLLFEGEFEGFCHAVLCCLASKERMAARVLKRRVKIRAVYVRSVRVNGAKLKKPPTRDGAPPRNDSGHHPGNYPVPIRLCRESPGYSRRGQK